MQGQGRRQGQQQEEHCQGQRQMAATEATSCAQSATSEAVISLQGPSSTSVSTAAMAAAAVASVVGLPVACPAGTQPAGSLQTQPDDSGPPCTVSTDTPCSQQQQACLAAAICFPTDGMSAVKVCTASKLLMPLPSASVSFLDVLQQSPLSVLALFGVPFGAYLCGRYSMPAWHVMVLAMLVILLLNILVTPLRPSRQQQALPKRSPQSMQASRH